MGGRPFRVVWRAEDTAAALKAAYQRERDLERRPRLHGLWLLRSGWRLREVAAVRGVHDRTVQRWVGWYRPGGVAEVCGHRAGGHGQPRWLTPEQEVVLREQAAHGSFATAEEARRWVAQEFGVTYRPKGIDAVLRRVECRPQVPPAPPRHGGPRGAGRLEKGAARRPSSKRG
jgi:transposase